MNADFFIRVHPRSPAAKTDRHRFPACLVPARKRRQRSHQTKAHHRGPYLTIRKGNYSDTNQAGFPERYRLHHDVGKEKLLATDYTVKIKGAGPCLLSTHGSIICQPRNR
jgi:hypothetical protein